MTTLIAGLMDDLRLEADRGVIGHRTRVIPRWVWPALVAEVREVMGAPLPDSTERFAINGGPLGQCELACAPWLFPSGGDEKPLDDADLGEMLHRAEVNVYACPDDYVDLSGEVETLAGEVLRLRCEVARLNRKERP